MQKTTIQWNMRQIKKMMENGTLKFSNPIQRGFCWDIRRMSLFIDTLIRDYITPPMYTIKTKENNSNIYDGIDGKQRCTTIKKFLSDEFVLGDIEEVEVDGDLMDISGLKFSELPDDIKDKIISYTFTVYIIDDVSEDEIEEIMSRLNNGKVLTSYEKARIKAVDLENIQKASQHIFFKKILTENAINKYANEQIVVQSEIALKESEPCLDASFVTNFMLNLELDNNKVEELKKIFNKLNNSYDLITKKKIKKLISKKTHLVAIVPVTLKAIEDEWSDEKLAMFLTTFYSDIPNKYVEASVQGSGHANNVKTRINLLKEAMENYKNDEDGNE